MDILSINADKEIFIWLFLVEFGDFYSRITIPGRLRGAFRCGRKEP